MTTFKTYACVFGQIKADWLPLAPCPPSNSHSLAFPCIWGALLPRRQPSPTDTKHLSSLLQSFPTLKRDLCKWVCYIWTYMCTSTVPSTIVSHHPQGSQISPHQAWPLGPLGGTRSLSRLNLAEILTVEDGFSTENQEVKSFNSTDDIGTFPLWLNWPRSQQTQVTIVCLQLQKVCIPLECSVSFGEVKLNSTTDGNPIRGNHIAKWNRITVQLVFQTTLMGSLQPVL